MNRQKTLFFSLLACTLIGGMLVSRPTSYPSSRPRITPVFQDMERTAAALKRSTPNTNTSPAPVAALVGHHLLAADLFRDTIQEIPSTKIRHVILIAPNHFLNGRGRVQTLREDFSTPYGIVQVDRGLVEQMIKDGVATAEPSTFIDEHGISNILPFIKKLLPAADVVPIVIWSGISQSRLDALRTALLRSLQSDTVIIGSFDCSHYVPSATAVAQDAITISALRELDLPQLKIADVDSPEGLWLLGSVARELGATSFTLDAATNSGMLTHALTPTEVTSYITGRFFR